MKDLYLFNLINQLINQMNNILYKNVSSNGLCDELIEYFNAVKFRLISASASPNFPPRKHLRNIPDDLHAKIKTEIYANLNKYYEELSLKDNIRIYYSDFGIVKSHVDTHTCLIYLTDDFTGGVLTIENKSFNNENIVVMPKKLFGIIFPKGYVHYTDELQNGNKIILVIDLKIKLY